MDKAFLFSMLLLAGAVRAQEYSVDFREAASFPSNIVPAGDLDSGDLYLTNVAGEQVLRADFSGVASDYGAKFKIEGLGQPVDDDGPLYLMFHYKPAAPKPAGGELNFRFTLTINGIETTWNAATQTGVVNDDWPLDCADWWLAVVDMQPLVDHWRLQTGSTGDMFVNTIHVGPGAIGKADEQYRDILYFRGFHFGSSATTLGLGLSGILPDDDPHWIPQGSVISLQPETNGTAYLVRYRIPLRNYVNENNRNFDIAEFASHAAASQAVAAGQTNLIDTGGLLPGTYDLVLANNGMVEAVHPFHLAFRDPPVSPHYAVSVAFSGQTNDLTTYYSIRRAEYIRDWGVDGKNIEIIENGPGNPQPVNAHSWAGISTDAYPITVRVKVLPAAEENHIDGTGGITLPLASAHVLPSSYGIPCWLEGADTIAFTLDRPEKVLVVPNYHEAMAIYTNLAVDHVPLSSFEDTYTSTTIPENFNANRASDSLSEGFKNPLVFLGRGPDAFVAELGLGKSDPGTLVVRPGDRPTQAALSAADTVWFEPGGHDLSRLGEHPSYRAFINAGQTFYLEEGAFVAAGFKKDEASGAADCRLVGRGTVSGINHFWGGGDYTENSLTVEVDVIDGLNFVDREGWGIDGGDLINDIALMGAWHGNCDGLDSLDHCTVLDSFLMAHDDNLKINDHTYAEHLVLYMLGLNAHPIMFKEMWDDVVFSNAVVRDVDVIGYWKQAYPGMNGWHRAGPGAIACLQTRNVSIENALFSDIRIESPHLARVFSFYNLYSEEEGWPYVPGWLDIYNVNNHSRISGLAFENITVNSPLFAWRSLLGSGFSNSFDNVSFANIDINGVRITEASRDDYFEVSGFVNGTGAYLADPVENLTFHGSLFSAWSNAYALAMGVTGDDDGDGVANLAEFALGGDPNDPSDRGTQPEFLTASGGFSYVHPTLAKRNPGINYTVETTDNLVSNVWNATGYTISGTNDLGGDFNVVSNWIPNAAETQQFIRLRIGLE